MARILILRHAKTEPPGGRDFDRGLTDEGRQSAAAMGRWIVDNDLTPEVVLASPAERARQTVLLAGEAWGLAESAVQWEPGIYEGDATTVLALMHTVLDESSLLLVGHNPTMQDLASRLAGGTRTLHPGDLAIVETDHPLDDLFPECARSVQIVRAKEPSVTS